MMFVLGVNHVSVVFSVRKMYIDLLNGNPRSAISPLDLEISQKCEQLLISEPTFFELKGSVGLYIHLTIYKEILCFDGGFNFFFFFFFGGEGDGHVQF